MRAIGDLLRFGAERPNPSAGPGHRTRARVGRFLKARSLALCYMVSRAVGADKGFDKLSGAERDRAVAGQYSVVGDCLANFFTRSDERFFDIVVGEILKMTYWPEWTEEQMAARRAQVAGDVRTGVLDEARGALAAPERELLAAELDRMCRLVTAPVRKSLDVVCVGDCYWLDVFTFLVGPMRKDGISVNPRFIGSYNPIQTREKLRAHADPKCAAVLYSPFSYTFSPDLARTLAPKRRQLFTRDLDPFVRPAIEEAASCLQLMAGLYECPIFVHNATNIRRHNSTPADRLKALISAPLRTAARARVNHELARVVEKLKTETGARVHLFDENALLGAHSEWALGRRFHDALVQHPTVLSLEVARRYRDLLGAMADLSTRKLVVCDLDNTVWDGEIGEGPVRHYTDRQAILRRLRERGVLLAINSKNDTRNVHWKGGLLDENDFIASQINWEPKSDNMRRIQQQLNLKTKDFVFIDDRGDQRELVLGVFPEIMALDATDERSWRLLDSWSHLTDPSDGGDRTQLYRERAAREGFLTATETEGPVDQAHLLARLGLHVTVRDAVKADVKRVVELINRTNQFNLNATRTTPREASDWLAGPNRRILVADGGDKFGQMGIVCAAFVETTGAGCQIPAFVLSCRVFGYGIESVVLSAIKRIATAAGAPRLVGRFQETPHNEPCRKMYPDHNFQWDGTVWVDRNPAETAAPPSWLQIEDRTANP